MTATDTLDKVVKRFLEARGYEDVQSVDFAPINFIATEDDEMVLIRAELMQEGLEPTDLDRQEAECALICTAVNGLISKTKIRFDTISITLVTDSQALIRHDINCLR